MSETLSGSYFAKPRDVKKDWILVDANNEVLGRLASQIAKVLRGKHKSYYTPHIDTGDNIIVINAKKIKLTGKKLKQKIYYRHTGYPGGIKERTPYDILSGERPGQVLKMAVKRMMPKESPLARKQLKNLHVYAAENHPHNAQNPKIINLTK